MKILFPIYFWNVDRNTNNLNCIAFNCPSRMKLLAFSFDLSSVDSTMYMYIYIRSFTIAMG